MKNLLKYEFRKTFFAKAVVLGVVLVAEIVFLIGTAVSKEETALTGALILVFCTFGGLMYLGIESVVILHRDMNTKQGYMLFMTPHSCYQILGAKVIENGLSLLAGGAFFAALGTLDLTIFFARFDDLNNLREMFSEMFRAVFQADVLTTQTLLSALFLMLCTWLRVVVTAYLADVISTALLSGKKGNGLISFVVFILLNVLLGNVQSLNYVFREITSDRWPAVMVCRGLAAVALSGIMYYVTARIMQDKLSV